MVEHATLDISRGTTTEPFWIEGERTAIVVEQIDKSIHTILNNQNPISKLFPASTKENGNDPGHYDHAWLRDNSMIGWSLINETVMSANLTRKKGEQEIALRNAGASLARGMLNLFEGREWQNGFNQEIEDATDEDGQKYRRLTQPAPPIHFKIDGSSCPWPTQNQPDSWGELLIFVATAAKNGIDFSPQEKKTLKGIARYLVRCGDNLKQSSMWEWGEVHSPSPISSDSLCAKGLGMIVPLLREDEELTTLIERYVRRTQQKIGSRYPVEYSIPEGHVGQADLATLVAFSLGSFEGQSLSRYFLIAKGELGAGEFPGQKRYINDHYERRRDGEAIWPMGSLLEAICFFNKAEEVLNRGSRKLSEEYRKRGDSCLDKMLMLSERFGFIPELLRRENGSFVSNENHLLWNDAFMMLACAKSIELSKIHGNMN